MTTTTIGIVLDRETMDSPQVSTRIQHDDTFGPIAVVKIGDLTIQGSTVGDAVTAEDLAAFFRGLAGSLDADQQAWERAHVELPLTDRIENVARFRSTHELAVDSGF